MTRSIRGSRTTGRCTIADPGSGTPSIRCRSCGSNDLIPVLDLGAQPLAADFPELDAVASLPTFPLAPSVCLRCWLLQLDDASPPEPIVVGASLENPSSTLQAHGSALIEEALALAGQGREPRVVELASHGGYLRPYLAARGVESVLVEGDLAAARALRGLGCTVVDGPLDVAVAERLVGERGPADLVLDNYLLAHVREPVALLRGIAATLAPGGLAVVELDHLLAVVEGRQFDAIRHGHYSYLSLTSLEPMLAAAGLVASAASTRSVYGGALRVVVRRSDAPGLAVDESVGRIRLAEAAAGLAGVEAYRSFATVVDATRRAVHAVLLDARREGRRVVAYGAPSRGSTLLNACGVTPDLVPFTVDRATWKHGRAMPGSGIPILPPERLVEARPDVVLILTWDIVDEVMTQLAEIRTWGGRFLVPIPVPRELS